MDHQGGIMMSNLKEEYTDTGDRTHKVEHIVVPAGDKDSKERIVEALFQALAGTGNKAPA